MRITPLKKIIITSLIALALIAGLLFAFVMLSNNVQAGRDMLAITAAKISSSEKRFVHLVTILDRIKNRTQDIQRIQHIAIDPYRPLPFIETMEQIGRSTNVKIALGVDEKKEDTPSLLFRATLEGNENNIRSMLALIQQLPYQITIEHISFQRDIPPIFNSRQPIASTMTRLLLTMRVATQQ